LALLLGWMGWASTAFAQAQQSDAIALERMRLATDPAGIIGVESGSVLRHLTWNAAAWAGWQNNPLIVYRVTDGERVGALVGNRVGGGLVGAVGLWDIGQLGVELPVVLFQDRRLGEGVTVGDLPALTPGGVGNLRLVPKVRLFNSADHGVDGALVLGVLVPIGSGAGFLGDPDFAFQPELALSRGFGAFRAAVNLGAAFRNTRTLLNLPVRNELSLQVGGAYRVGSLEEGTLPLELSLTLGGNVAAAAPFVNAGENAFEARLLAAYQATKSTQVFLGGGRGLSRGWGTPDWRAFGGVRFSPDLGTPAVAAAPRDGDADGVPDTSDKCPAEAGPAALRGCPDPDPDKDGLAAAQDACPNEAGPVENKGCADKDSDADGVVDRLDGCPGEAGLTENKGCPDKDSDADGIVDRQDGCPAESGPADNKGCPDKDADADGIVDRQDGCPGEAGPVENKGCPDKDTDGDKVVNRLDECPDLAGPAATKGCPKGNTVKLVGNRIEFKGTVYFDTNKDVIQKRSFPLLDSIATVIKAHPEIQKVHIEGHTDDRGKPAHNLDLSQRRSEAIKRYMVGKGVAPERLGAQGFGQTRPVASNKTADGRSQNRRVEFRVDFDETTDAPAQPEGATPPGKQ
jgi:outer membrane protein OmpA-like peptidoglycan-associated protein